MTRRGLRAFAMAELIAAVAIAAVVTLPLGAALKHTAHLYKTYRDERAASRRAETVAAILKMPLRFCALGIPSGAQEYRKAFGAKIIAPFNWDGPISVADVSGRQRLRIAYAFSEGARTAEACSGAGKEASPLLTREPDGNYFDMGLFDKSRSVKNWILFPDAYPEEAPLTVTGISGRTLRLKSYTEEDYQIPKGARLFLFRAIECWSDGDKFYTNDFRTTGGQPRASGVIGARFTLNDSGNMLTLCLMVRGEDAGLAGKKIKNHGCPEDFLTQWDAGAQNYALYAFRFVWNLPNVGRGGTL